MDPQRLYELHAAASVRGGAATESNARDDQIAGCARSFLSSRGKTAPELVELAIGDGSLAFTLARHMPKARIVGVDIAAARIDSAAAASARLGLHDRMDFRILDIERDLKEIASGSADALFAIDVLEHLFDVFAFVSQIARIVRPGGLAVLRVPNVGYLRHRLSLALGNLPITASWFGPAHDLTAWRSTWGWDGGHLHYFTRPTLKVLLEDAGFHVLEWRDPGTRLEKARRVFPNLLIGNLCVFVERREAQSVP